jgi:uncharacterized OsmC-like protein
MRRFRETLDKVRKNPTGGKKIRQIEGEWRVDKTGHQFEATVKTERGGEYSLRSDETLILGGGGTSPNPIQYCIFGLIACYAATYAKWAAMEGILLKSFKIKATVSLDLTKAFGVTENPIFEHLQLEMAIDSDVDMNTLNRLKEIAKARSPCFYYATHQIVPEVKIRKT